jgi:propionyl-CoA carboxylase alpha chain
MLAKVIAVAPTRERAASTLATALERCHLGGVATNREFLAATLRHPAFLAGDTTTDFIERHEPDRTLVLPAHELLYAARSGTLWVQAVNRERATVWDSAPSGWRNARLAKQQLHVRHGDEDLVVHYASRRDGRFMFGDVSARVHAKSDTALDVEIDGIRRTVRITMTPDHLFVQAPQGTVAFVLVPQFVAPGHELDAGGLHAPMPGTVLEVRVSVGDLVSKGDTLVVLEAMKMEHRIAAPHDGVVTEVLVSAGSQVENGASLLVLEETGE